jgi:endonuclease YncB( thermonuclease family)
MRWGKFALWAAALCWPSPAISQRCVEYTRFRADVRRVVDGDTLELWIQLGLGIARVETVRLMCVDTPEVTGTTRTAGLAAKAFTQGWANEHVVVSVHTRLDDDRDKYGRLLVSLYPVGGGLSLNAELLLAKHATLYQCKSPEELP